MTSTGLPGKEQRPPRGSGRKAPSQPTADLERQSQARGSTGTMEKLGKTTRAPASAGFQGWGEGWLLCDPGQGRQVWRFWQPCLLHQTEDVPDFVFPSITLGMKRGISLLRWTCPLSHSHCLPVDLGSARMVSPMTLCLEGRAVPLITRGSPCTHPTQESSRGACPWSGARPRGTDCLDSQGAPDRAVALSPKSS